MPGDTYITIAPDVPGGTLVDMEQVTTSTGASAKRQRAVLVGETGDILQSIFIVQLQQLACLRSMLAILRADHPGSLGEEDFSKDLTPNDY